MKNLKHGLLAASFLLSNLASAPLMACTEDGKEGFLPENDLYISVNDKNVSGITEEEFNAVIDKYEAAYAPIISNLGATLRMNRLWTNGTVNASAQQIGKTWIVNMFGGLARHKTITSDGFALVVCHELGHHLAGAPLYSWKTSWASTEGQSDYFATTKCLRKVWQSDDNAAIVAAMGDVPEALKAACGKTWTWDVDYNICIRGGMAGMSVGNLFAALRNQPEGPKFETPDSRVVSRTQESHPATQCRLDTYFQGALCEVSMNEDFSRTDEKAGSCHAVLGHSIGARPLCWHKPVTD